MMKFSYVISRRGLTLLMAIPSRRGLIVVVLLGIGAIFSAIY